MLPEVFECPQCQRQFVFELVENTDDRSIYCPQCKRYLGEKDLNFILVSEIEELSERLRFERERLEKDEAVYAMSDCDAELKLYGNEIHKVVTSSARLSPSSTPSKNSIAEPGRHGRAQVAQGSAAMRGADQPWREDTYPIVTTSFAR